MALTERLGLDESNEELTHDEIIQPHPGLSSVHAKRITATTHEPSEHQSRYVIEVRIVSEEAEELFASLTTDSRNEAATWIEYLQDGCRAYTAERLRRMIQNDGMDQ